MREIKFRAWDKFSEELVEIKTLDFERSEGATCAVDYSDINGDLYSEWVLEQYTGLKDKNGTYIYEGDILKNGNDEYGVIKFGEYEQDGSNGEYNPENCLGFYIEFPSRFNTPSCCQIWQDSPACANDNVSSSFKVIGNIHEKPELLAEE